MIFLAHLSEQVLPDVFRVAEYGLDEIDPLLFRGIFAGRSACFWTAAF